jgi:hypothetical protein
MKVPPYVAMRRNKEEYVTYLAVNTEEYVSGGKYGGIRIRR